MGQMQGQWEAYEVRKVTAGVLSLPLTDRFGKFKLVVVFSLFGSDPAK